MGEGAAAWAGASMCLACGRTVRHKPHGGPHRFHWCRLRWLSRRGERIRAAAWEDGYRFACDHIEEPMVYADVREYGSGWAGVIKTGIVVDATGCITSPPPDSLPADTKGDR